MMFLKAILAGLLASPATLAAQLTKVNYPNDASSKVDMYIYVPDKVVANPPLVVVIHSCQSSAQAYFQNSLIPWHRGSDNKGYITVWPSSPHSGTCWDVSSKATLTHGGGGDTQAISNMIKYAISQYKVDVSKVFVTGGSSGGKHRSFGWAPQDEQEDRERGGGGGFPLCRDCICSLWLMIIPISSHDVQRFSGDVPRADPSPFIVLRCASWLLLVVLWGRGPVELVMRVGPSERDSRGLGKCCPQHVPRI